MSQNIHATHQVKESIIRFYEVRNSLKPFKYKFCKISFYYLIPFMVNLKYFFLIGSGTIIVDRVSNYFMGGRLKHMSPYLKQTISWEYAVNYACSICNTSDTHLLSIPVIRGCIYSDRQLTLNFELWVEIFVCRNVSIWGFQNRVCLSVRWSVCPSVSTPRKETPLASSISVLH